MHTFQGKTVTIHHNGDYSGEATVICGDQEIKVACEDLLEFVAGAVRTSKVGKIEDADYKELLGL